MYHWRILKDKDSKSISHEEQITLDKDATYWENNPRINSRLKAIASATYHTYSFLEFTPNHLYGWLNKQLSTNANAAINAVRLVENQMQTTNYFMGSQNFLHMDTHFENILTDTIEIIANRINICSTTLNIDAQRITDWLYAKSVLSWAWSLEDKLDPSYWPKFLEKISI